MLKSKLLPRAASFILMLILLMATSPITALAMTPEESAAIKEAEKWLDGVKVVSQGKMTFSSDSATGNAQKAETSRASETESSAKASSSTIDLHDYAVDSIALVNTARSKAGLDKLMIDEEMMELAAIRAREISEKWGHERPDGTRVSQEYFYAEIISGKSTPQKAVDGWMASTKGHKEIITSHKYQTVGAGCYQDENGRVFFVQLFFK